MIYNIDELTDEEKKEYYKRAEKIIDKYFHFFRIPDYVPKKFLKKFKKHLVQFFIDRERIEEKRDKKDKTLEDINIDSILEEYETAIKNLEGTNTSLEDWAKKTEELFNTLLSTENSFSQMIRDILNKQDSYDWFGGLDTTPVPSTPDPGDPEVASQYIYWDFTLYDYEESPGEITNTLIGAKTNCTININNPSVLELRSFSNSTGIAVFRVLGNGDCTVTAKAEETDEYSSASASFNVHIGVEEVVEKKQLILSIAEETLDITNEDITQLYILYDSITPDGENITLNKDDITINIQSSGTLLTFNKEETNCYEGYGFLAFDISYLQAGKVIISVEVPDTDNYYGTTAYASINFIKETEEPGEIGVYLSNISAEDFSNEDGDTLIKYTYSYSDGNQKIIYSGNLAAIFIEVSKSNGNTTYSFYYSRGYITNGSSTNPILIGSIVVPDEVDLSNIEEQIEDFKDEINEIINSISLYDGEIKAIENDIDIINKSISSINNNISSLETTVTENTSDITNINNTLVQIESKIESIGGGLEEITDPISNYNDIDMAIWNYGWTLTEGQPPFTDAQMSGAILGNYGQTYISFDSTYTSASYDLSQYVGKLKFIREGEYLVAYLLTKYSELVKFLLKPSSDSTWLFGAVMENAGPDTTVILLGYSDYSKKYINPTEYFKFYKFT